MACFTKTIVIVNAFIYAVYFSYLSYQEPDIESSMAYLIKALILFNIINFIT